ncbi:MAG: hypothetical protein HC811_10865, partial [Flammeovirgaceae bacterium]|nr:hypothetical protein [Flammeovirgaceae bacterium]
MVFFALESSFNLDSAYQYVLRSTASFNQTSDRDKERLQRFPLDSSILVDLRQEIDSAAFERAKSINTESAYISFIHEFSFAREKESAIELRNEVAYIDALKVNTYESFLAYVQRYPQSLRTAEAEQRYERLLYEAKTKDGKLTSLEAFLKEYPQTTYRPAVEKRIFEISTSSGDEKDFINFAKKYSTSEYVDAARDIVFHIARQNDTPFPSSLLNDSLRNIINLEKGYWIPIFRGGFYGFINDQGHDIITPKFKNINEDYLCGEISDDVLETSAGLISRSGEVIFKGAISKAEELGYGFVLVKTKNCTHLIHKSGRKFNNDCIADALIIAGRFLAVKTGLNWGLYAFNGNEILAPSYLSISAYNDLIILSRTEKKSLFTINEIIKVADGGKLIESMVFD